MSDQPPHGRAVITAMLHHDAEEAIRIMNVNRGPEQTAYLLTYLSSALAVMVDAYATTLGMDPVTLWQEECLKVERLLDAHWGGE